MADWSEFQFGVDKIVDLGDRVLLIGWMSGSGIASGAGFKSEWANLLTLSPSGTVVREQYFPTHREGLEAAGLSE